MDKVKNNLPFAFFEAFAFFIVTVLIAQFFKWDIADIAWSIWLTTYFASVLAALVASVAMFCDSPAEKQHPDYKPMYFDNIYLSATFILVVVSGNWAAGLAFQEILPILSPRDEIKLFEIEAEVFLSYWPFLLVSLIKPCMFYYQIFQQDKYKDSDTEYELIWHMVVFILKAAVLLFVLMGLIDVVSDFLVYWVLLLFYFFPWTEMWQWSESEWSKRKAKK